MANGKLTRDLRALEGMVSREIYEVLMRGVETFTEDSFYDPGQGNNAINALAALVFDNFYAKQTLCSLGVLKEEASEEESYLRSMDDISETALQLYAKVLREEFQEVYPETIIPKLPAGSAMRAPFEMLKGAFGHLHSGRDEVAAAAFVFHKLRWVIQQTADTGRFTPASLSSAYLNLISGVKENVIYTMKFLGLNPCNPDESWLLGGAIAEMLRVFCMSSKIELQTTQPHILPSVEEKVDPKAATDLFVEIDPEAAAVIAFFTKFMAEKYGVGVEVTVKSLKIETV